MHSTRTSIAILLLAAAVPAAFTLVATVRLLTRGRAGKETRVEFVPMPRTIQSVFALEEPDSEPAESDA